MADAAEKTVEKTNDPSSVGFLPCISSSHHLRWMKPLHLIHTNSLHSIIPLHRRHHCQSRHRFQQLRSSPLDGVIPIAFLTTQNEAEAGCPDHQLSEKSSVRSRFVGQFGNQIAACHLGHLVIWEGLEYQVQE